MDEPQGILKGLKVLLVDDDEDCRQFIALALQTEGVTLVEAIDAEQGVEALKTQTFDLVATDKNLPNMDGIGFIQHIRRHYGDLPVILITGFGSIGSAVEALKFGAQDYLVKPISDVDLLTRAVLNAVQQHRLARENKMLQQKLIRAQRMESVGVLAGGVAHELNNTLAPIIGLPAVIEEQLDSIWSQFQGAGVSGKGEPQTLASLNLQIAKIHDGLETLKESARDLSVIKEQLHLMERSGRRAAAVVKDLLTFSESGLYTKEPQDLNAVIRRIMEAPEIVEIKAQHPDVNVGVDLHPSVPAVIGSTSHFERVFVHLIRNAFQAIGRRGTPAAGQVHGITVRTSALTTDKRTMAYEVIEPGDYVVVEIADSGVGLAPKEMDRIFEPFYTTREISGGAGTGLGLSIVYRVVKDHGGYIDISSQPGQGLTVRLYLRAEKSIEKAAPAPAASGPASRSVLVVDDETSARNVVKFLLIRLGYRVTTAIHGHDALQIIQEAQEKGNRTPFDLVMLDMVMEPGFDGLATFEEIERLCPGQKVIVSSGFAPTERAKAIIDHGAGWLGKPYGVDELRGALSQKLG